MATKKRKLVVNAADVSAIMGLSLRSAQRVLRAMKLSLGKDPSQYITVEEFCYEKGLTPEEVYDALDSD